MSITVVCPDAHSHPHSPSSLTISSNLRSLRCPPNQAAWGANTPSTDAWTRSIGTPARRPASAQRARGRPGSARPLGSSGPLSTTRRSRASASRSDDDIDGGFGRSQKWRDDGIDAAYGVSADVAAVEDEAAAIEAEFARERVRELEGKVSSLQFVVQDLRSSVSAGPGSATGGLFNGGEV